MEPIPELSSQSDLVRLLVWALGVMLTALSALLGAWWWLLRAWLRAAAADRDARAKADREYGTLFRESAQAIGGLREEIARLSGRAEAWLEARHRGAPPRD